MQSLLQRLILVLIGVQIFGMLSANAAIDPRCLLLLESSSLEFGALPYDKFEDAHFNPALRLGLLRTQTRINALKQDTRPPTFENTIEAIEAAFEPVEQAYQVFNSYLSLRSSPELEQIAEKIKPRISRLSNSINLDSAIFARVESIYNQREKLNLSTEQKALLEITRRNFVRNGAKLGPVEKARVDAIDEKLSVLGERFRKNVLAVTKSFKLVITDAKDVAGLPQSALDAAEETGTNLGHPGAWVFTLDQSSFGAFMKYAENTLLREQMWRAFSARAATGNHDNRPILLEIAKLREERAHLLGYQTHAHFILEPRMAGNPKTVEDFLGRLASVYKPAAEKDVEELRVFAGHELMPWDVAYYSEKLRSQRYNYNEEEVRPYLSLDQVVKGAFYVAEKLYGITFRPRTDLPTWDPNVRAFEVRDKNGDFLSLFYLDPFPRRGAKRIGAWMTTMQDAGLFDGKLQRPHVINVGNLTPPVKGEPSLLPPREVITVFHELGHGLHGMLTRVGYRSLSGTSVSWDFVELPSQLNENWAFEPEVLDIYAHHYKTGERIPKELVEKMRKAMDFQAGFSGLVNVRASMLDLAWHARDLSSVKTIDDVRAWEEQAITQYHVLPAPGALASTSFAHIFAGGYSAGYYSYKWADVLAADAYSVFQKEGIFNPKVADRFRTEVLEKGGTEEAAELYRRFKGSDPDPDALLKKEGLIK